MNVWEYTWITSKSKIEQLHYPVPVFGSSCTHYIPVLMVPQTNYPKDAPVIIGTNFIRICRNDFESSTSDEELPDEYRHLISLEMSEFVDRKLGINTINRE